MFPKKSKRISYMNLFQAKISFLNLSGQSFSIFDSRKFMNIFAYVGATLVPIAVPKSWRQNSPLNSKIFPSKTSLSNLIRKSVGICCSSRLSSSTLNASMPSSNGMFVYMDFKSRAIGLQFTGSSPLSFNSWKYLSKSGVSSIKEFCFFTNSLPS